MFDRPNSSKAIDWNDAVKLTNPDANLATVSEDNKQLSIDARPYTASLNIPLYLNIGAGVASNTQFNLSVPDFDLSDSRTLYLFDKFNNTYSQIVKGFVYPFEINVNDSSTQFNRFALTANAKANFAINSNGDTKLTAAVVNNINTLNVMVNANPSNNTQINMYDMNGRKIISKNIGMVTNASTPLDITGTAHGIYLVEVSNGNDKVLIKTMRF